MASQISTTDSSNILTLTTAETDQAAYVLYTSPVGATKGLSIAFDFYSYGGTGADGLCFFMIDGTQTPIRPGGFGGSLGYAPRTDANKPGLVGAYLGIGFDDFGRFSDGAGGRGTIPDSIAVRGSQANNYVYLTGTDTLPITIDNPTPTATRETSRRHAQITLTPGGLLSVQVDLNVDGDFDDPGESDPRLQSFNVVSKNGALPATFKFGFAASTGSLTNIHEVGNFDVKDASGNSLGGSFTQDIILVGTEQDDSLAGGKNNDTILGLGGNDSLTGKVGNDTLTGADGDDTLVGSAGQDKLIGDRGSDTLTGGDDADYFIFSGASQKLALATSLLPKPDRILDFKVSQGDKIQLDFDSNRQTAELPKGLFSAGKQKGKTLKQAIGSAFADKNRRKKGAQALKGNEGVFFTFKEQTYLAINDKKPGFAANSDLLVNVTGIEFAPSDLKAGVLSVNSYFIG